MYLTTPHIYFVAKYLRIGISPEFHATKFKCIIMYYSIM